MHNTIQASWKENNYCEKWVKMGVHAIVWHESRCIYSINCIIVILWIQWRIILHKSLFQKKIYQELWENKLFIAGMIIPLYGWWGNRQAHNLLYIYPLYLANQRVWMINEQIWLKAEDSVSISTIGGLIYISWTIIFFSLIILLYLLQLGSSCG